MLSEKVLLKEKITEICRNDNTFFKKGMMFDKIVVSDSDFRDPKLCGSVTFLGFTDCCEMLLSSGNGRYYFTVRDGWGVEDNCLYALSVGEINRDFQRTVTTKEIEYMANNPPEPRGFCSAMVIGAQTEADKKILQVLKQDVTTGL